MRLGLSTVTTVTIAVLSFTLVIQAVELKEPALLTVNPETSFFIPADSTPSQGEKAVSLGSKYCLNLSGQLLKPFPQNSDLHIFFFNSTEVVKEVKTPLCSTLVSAPSITGCSKAEVTNGTISSCVMIDKFDVEPSSGQDF
ncbi:hypothetical protein BCR41DRAFT_388587 [Lobosporangium transversale]|uniref:Uncharacterized protein n=1 Tax=Lobosporangium transversale TaxID=64571 RepID=A0A1Y2GEA8_9FUNG|nr:hypothetical protein BCR41DRAFT_388587 [Lobosporangium transversale]ORZ08485.1 hypothetical protein BCR41DRAFT_388587 [Lobosporangium transversale]|eukprot:XP_021878413.1 hypothetical protein BCR41DRAFT_388587 [Lobosporangium transversale]